jgi:two-component system, NtrC family, response regulator AtoC
MFGSEQSETLPRRSANDAAPLGLFVIGPTGNSRHLLPSSGVVTIGRGAECTIVVDDRRVSRRHVAVHVSDAIAISDLGSVNGTFVGATLLRPGEVRALAAGETFSVGDSALVVRPASIASPSGERFIAASELADRLGIPRSLAVLRIRVRGTTAERWLDAILSDLPDGQEDWMLELEPGYLSIGFPARAARELPLLEREARTRLASWGIEAHVESLFVPALPGDAATSSVLAFLRSQPEVRTERGSVIIRDPAMEALRRVIARIAPTPVNILLLGETGTGKDVMASMLHELSPRAPKQFVRLNCASLPESLLESELFGYERGAFTGASAPKPGLLEVADGGTVFFDEVGELSLALQAKILRAIESREITRLGALRPRDIDVRFVAATNRDLTAEMEAGRFRRDLFYRLTGVTLTVPPLRDRPSEVLPLAQSFIEAACKRFALPSAELSNAASAALMAHAWPGNVRELRNAIERAVLLAGQAIIQPSHLALSANAVASPAISVAAGDEPPLSERDRIVSVLASCAGNQSRAAALMGISRRTLVRRIAQLRLPRPHR